MAYGINDSGQVVGYGYNGTAPQAFIGTAAGITPIPLPAGWTSSLAFGINDSGQVVGYVENATTSQAFIGTAAGLTPIAVPAGWTISEATAINNSGQILGGGSNSETGYTGVVILTPRCTDLSIVTTALRNAQSASPYGPVSLGACGGTSPYTWKASGLPPGFAIEGNSLSSSGNPTAPAGTYQVTLTVTDSAGLTASATLPLVVQPTFNVADPNACTGGSNPLVSADCGGFLDQPASWLVSQSRPVAGVAADGVTEVILWAPSTVPLTLSLGPGDGMLAPAGTTLWSSSVTVNPVSAGDSGMVVLVLYLAPIDFVRSGSTTDAAAASRPVMVTVAGAGATPKQFPITLVRPPVMLVHGFTSNSTYWDTFTPLVGDPRFAAFRADYSFSVPGVLQSFSPEVSFSFLAPALRANVLGFAYNAKIVFGQFQQYLYNYRQGAGPAGSLPVAATQVDVVAHSMGGLITRTMPFVADQFYGPANYGQGIVHKLITLGTPHLGSPLSIASLDPGSTCTQVGSAAAGQYTLDSVVIDGTKISGGAGDLVGDGRGQCLSPALHLLQTPLQSRCQRP